MKTRVIILVIGVLAAISAVGCSRARVPVTLLHPAELELSGKPMVILGEFPGRGGRAVSARLRSLLGQSGFVLLSDGAGEVQLCLVFHALLSYGDDPGCGKQGGNGVPHVGNLPGSQPVL